MDSKEMFENLSGAERLSCLFAELLKLLQKERLSLQAFDGQALDENAAHKQALCQAIDTFLHSEPELALSLQKAANSEPEQVDPDHKKLLALAIEARDYNLVNGKILNRSQQSVREILGLLSGNSIDGLYGQSGQQTAVPGPGANAIAQA